MADVRAHVFVSGRVQGVGYRAWTIRTAKALSICGWVRNLDDDRVEAVLEGAKDLVEQMIAEMHKGPTFAKVSEVDSKLGVASGEFSTFQSR